VIVLFNNNHNSSNLVRPAGRLALLSTGSIYSA